MSHSAVIDRKGEEAEMSAQPAPTTDRPPDGPAATPMSTTAKPASKRRSPPDERGHGGGGPLERVTVNLIARASRALQRVSDLTGDTKTDSINRALVVYAYLEEVSTNGGAIYVRETKDSELQLLKMF